MTQTIKRIPGKRLKTWHRTHKREGGTLSLRAFARSILASSNVAREWAGGKVAPK